MSGRAFVGSVLPPLVPLVVAVAVMEALVRLGWVPRFLLPAPSQVAQTLWVDREYLGEKMLETGLAAVLGFGLSAVVGLVIAVALSSARWVQRAFYPYAVFFQTVPIIAIAPLLVIWLGFGLPTIVASAFIASVFPVIANALAGLLSTDPSLRDLFRLYGASNWATLLKLRLPFALPSILTGLRVAGGLAVIGAIVGEFIGGGGLGDVVEVAKTQQRIDQVFAAVLLAALLGLALFAAINFASRLALRNWHASEVER
jgi:NitT/TauT family transport system permease protein